MAWTPPPFGFGSSSQSSVLDPFSPDLLNPYEASPFLSSLASLTRFDASYDASNSSDVRIDWRETPEAHIYKADLPGIDKEGVRVDVLLGLMLQISGEWIREHAERTVTWHCVERTTGKFLRRFFLPQYIMLNQLKAKIKDGVLTVTVPKETEILYIGISD